MKIGRLEIIWNKKAIDHPDHWSKRRIEKTIEEIEAHWPNSKIERIKILRALTHHYSKYDDPFRWSLKEQKEWIERNYKRTGRQCNAKIEEE